MLYKIELTLDGEKVAPKGTVQMSIGMPEGYVKDKISVYGFQENEKLIKIYDAVVINNEIVFETNKVSYFAIATTELEDNVKIETEATPFVQNTTVPEKNEEAAFQIGIFIAIASVIAAIVIFFIAKKTRVKVKIVNK